MSDEATQIIQVSTTPGTILGVVSGVTAVVSAVTGFLVKRLINKVDDTAEALAKHEKEDIGKYATADQLQRVHERIDESIKTAEGNFKELRDNVGEIKTILIHGVHK